jgi:hypothetical protein
VSLVAAMNCGVGGHTHSAGAVLLGVPHKQLMAQSRPTPASLHPQV